MKAADGGAFGYFYDFADGWQHRITFEDRTPPDRRHLYRRLVDARGRCPPEDVGGIPG
jgi:hypothetical protein